MFIIGEVCVDWRRERRRKARRAGVPRAAISGVSFMTLSLCLALPLPTMPAIPCQRMRNCHQCQGCDIIVKPSITLLTLSPCVMSEKFDPSVREYVDMVSGARMCGGARRDFSTTGRRQPGWRFSVVLSPVVMFCPPELNLSRYVTLP